MNTKALACYSVVRILTQLAWCYAIYLTILVIAQIVAPEHDPLGMPFRLLGVLPALFPLMMGLIIALSDVSFLVQNGLTRCQVFGYVMASMAFVAFVMACIEVLCTALVPFWTGQSVFYLIRGESGLMIIFAGVFLSNFVIALCAFTAISLSLRVGAAAMMVASSLIIAIFVTSLVFFGSIRPGMNVMMMLAGLTIDGEGTPLSAIATYAIELVALVPLSFLILRKLEVSHSLGFR